MASLYITISRLDNNEMPVASCLSDILHLPVENLSRGVGCSTLISEDSVGYLVFVRNDSNGNTDKKALSLQRYYVPSLHVADTKRSSTQASKS